MLTPLLGRMPRPAVGGLGEVLLVSCYELGRQPLSLAWPLAFLEQAGYRPVTVDTAVEDLTDGALQRARVIAVATPMHTALRLAVPILERARRVNPTARRIAFGLYAGLNEGYLRESGLVDAVLSGEIEQPLLELLADWGRSASVPDVAGERSQPTGPGQPSLMRLDFPVPDRVTLPAPERYARLLYQGEERLAGSAESTRGCRHTCRHCPITPIYGGHFYAVPVATVLADIRQQVQAGVRHISFGDPDFLNGPTHALRVARSLHAEFSDLTFDATIKIEHLLRHRTLMAELADLGCIFVVSAVESLSDDVLLRLDKGHTRADVVAALAQLDAVGVALRPSLLAFTPWTTARDYLELLDWVLAEGLDEHVDPVHFAIRLLVPPGSALLTEPSTGAWFGDLDAANFSHAWRHPDPRMDDLYAAVSDIVCQATDQQWPAVATLDALRGRVTPLVDDAGPAPVRRQRPTPPRLTESWFCCAEPSANLVDPLRLAR